MRDLKTSDIFKASKILKKMNLKFQISEGMTKHEAGVHMITQVVENLHLAEKEVNEFMGSLIGISGKEFSELTIVESMKHIEELKKQDILGFLSLASKSTK